jgi:predicted nucleic acid-binding protein
VALTHLVDTSALTRLGRPEVRAVVEPLALAGRLARVTISDLEVGYSARSAAEWDRFVGSLDAFVRVDTTAGHLRRAMQVQRLLASRHQRGRKIPDLLVAAAAEELDVAVLHYDADFDHIARVTGQPCQWVVARGSID